MRKNSKYIGTVSTKEIKDAVKDVLNLDIHPWPGETGIDYFRDARPRSNFIRYKLMVTEATPDHIQALQNLLPGAEVKVWKTQRWAFGRGMEVICIYVPIKEVILPEKSKLQQAQEEYNALMSRYGRSALGICIL